MNTKKECVFCRRNINEIDYKDEKTLKKYVSSLAKIKPREKNWLCARHQRKLANAVKRARFLGLLPFSPK
jgi:small subunit ribosomal protein S18